MPALEAARLALQDLDKSDVTEIRLVLIKNVTKKEFSKICFDVHQVLWNLSNADKIWYNFYRFCFWEYPLFFEVTISNFLVFVFALFALY